MIQFFYFCGFCGLCGETVPFSLAESVSPSLFLLFSGLVRNGLDVFVFERPSCLPDMLPGPPGYFMALGYFIEKLLAFLYVYTRWNEPGI